MAANPPVYRKLTGVNRSLGFLSQLWLGPDHLLHVHSTGYTETYRRFYLRDIQAMLIIHTGMRLYINLTLGGLAFFVMLISHALDGQWFADGVIAAVFLPLILWNTLLGPGSRVILVTAVQQEKIPALARLRRTRRVLARITPLIQAAQADLVPVPVSAPVGPEIPAPAAPPRPANVPPPLPPPLST